MTSLNFIDLSIWACVGAMMVTTADNIELIQDGHRIIDDPFPPECIYVCSDEEPFDEYTSYICVRE